MLETPVDLEPNLMDEVNEKLITLQIQGTGEVGSQRSWGSTSIIVNYFVYNFDTLLYIFFTNQKPYPVRQLMTIDSWTKRQSRFILTIVLMIF